jgi:lambda family phage portal protein
VSTNWFFLDDNRPRRRANSLDGFNVPPEREYRAASTGRRLRMWRAPLSGPNSAVARDRQTILARSRSQSRNDPWAGTALDRSLSNGIGTGILAKMVNGTDAEKAAVKKLWNSWCKVCDADGMLDYYGQQGLAWLEWREAGEMFARLRPRRPTDELPVPLQVQLLESEQCPSDLNTIASNGNVVRAGIEFNGIGRRTAYWFYREHPGDAAFFSIANASELVRVPADQVVHLYRPWRIGQQRGIPDHVSAMVRMFNLDNLDDAVLERQKIANLFAGFYKKTIDPENPDSMIDEMTRSASSDEQETDFDDTPLAGLEPGTMQDLPPGVEPVFSQPPAPGTEYGEFMRGGLMAIAARYGVPYEVLTGDLRGVSDRALKLILNEFRRLLEMLQWQYFIPMFCQRIREAFFDSAYVAGVLQLADYETRREEYVETLWVPQGWPYSHPVQDVKADIEAISAGLTSRTKVALGAGEDAEEIEDEQAADNERADAKGLVFTSDGRVASKKGASKPGADPNDPNAPDDPNAPPEDRPTGADPDEATAGDPPAAGPGYRRADLAYIADAIRAMPAPVVNVAPATVEVHPPNINVAPAAVTVNVEPPKVEPRIEVAAPQVNVEVQREPRTTIRTLERGDSGLVERIIDREG